MVKSSRESGVRRRATTATKEDFTIECQTDHIVMVKDQLPSTINRSCTISTYGTFSDSISLSCSSLDGIGCKIKPSSVLISDNPSYVDNITVTIAIDNGILLTTTTKEMKDIVVTASYDTDKREEAIPIVILGSADQIVPRNDDIITTSDTITDYFLLSGQSNMQGHSTSERSLTGNDTYWLDIKQLLEDEVDPAIMESKLQSIIKAGQLVQHEFTESVMINLANETMKLYNQGLLNDLNTPLSLGR